MNFGRFFYADREVRNLTVMEMNPKQPADQLAAVIRELERSARAELKLRKAALDYARSQQE